MKNIQLTLPLAGFTVSLLLLMITNSIHLLAFAPIQPSPGSSTGSPTTRPLQQPQPSTSPQTNTEGQSQPPIIPHLFPPPTSQPSTTRTTPAPAPPLPPILIGGVTANGTINSLIYAPTSKWIATGNWSVVVNDGGISSFITHMTWYNNNGTGTHTHELQNFRPTEQPKITIQPGINAALKGLMDVGTNHRIVWHNVHSTIYIKGGRTISISLDDQETNHHFAGQTIYGVVHSLTRCSDTPLPNMEVLPPCR
jgi:hypothetical protein